MSSASTTAAAALLAAHGETSAYIAGLATIVTSAGSAASNLPVINRVTGSLPLIRRLVLSTAVIVVAGPGITASEILLHNFH